MLKGLIYNILNSFTGEYREKRSILISAGFINCLNTVIYARINELYIMSLIKSTQISYIFIRKSLINNQVNPYKLFYIFFFELLKKINFLG